MAKATCLPGDLTRWDSSENSTAPLTERQKEYLRNLEEELLASGSLISEKTTDEDEQNDRDSSDNTRRIERYEDVLECYAELEKEFISAEDTKYKVYLEDLKTRRQECQRVCDSIKHTLDDLSLLFKQYAEVSDKTSSLHHASEELIFDQKRLNSAVENIANYVKYFKEIDIMMEKLEAPTLSVNSEAFFNILEKVDTNMDVLQNNSNFKESSVYLVKYRHCQSKIVTSIQNYIFSLLSKTTESILNFNENESSQENTDAALALFYGRFQAVVFKAKPVIERIEAKSSKRQEYNNLLTECHQYYWNQRGLVLGPSIQKSLSAIKERYNGDHCSLVRHSCSLLLHASVDEYKLFYEFFSKPTTGLTTYLESLCTSLYDAIRPFIIHINHLETLAEICCILRIEMLDEHVQNNFEPLEGFGNICLQLLHDVQERLVFRAHLYLQSDILNYNPSPGDLAYPEKLKMMEDIAESIREEARQLRMKRISVSSNDSNILEPVSRSHIIMDSIYQKSHMGNSPADLHGMWYPTVRRTLVCLSRLYRCVDRSVFQSLSQEAISACVQSIQKAKNEIELRTSPLDAELFQIKHLLILREQIAPFQVDFTIKEYSLDFSRVKTAAFGLLEKSSKLFTLSNNALLEFLLEGAPKMKEQLIDSRKQVDNNLKHACQRLIQHATYMLINPIVQLLEKEKTQANATNSDSTKKVFGSAQEVNAIVADVLRTIKFKLPVIQQSMQLYLANKETEFILLRPIKNNISAAFAQLYQLLGKYYTAEELLLIACPLPEQISVVLSSSSLIQNKSTQSTRKNSQEKEEL